MKTIASLLACVTLCSCSVLQDDYKYTTMRKLHLEYHTAGNRPLDCGWCTRDLRQAEQSMMVSEKAFDLTTPIL